MTASSCISFKLNMHLLFFFLSNTKKTFPKDTFGIKRCHCDFTVQQDRRSNNKTNMYLRTYLNKLKCHNCKSWDEACGSHLGGIPFKACSITANTLMSLSLLSGVVGCDPTAGTHIHTCVCAQVSQAPAGSHTVISFCEWNRHYRWAKKKKNACHISLTSSCQIRGLDSLDLLLPG